MESTTKHHNILLLTDVFPCHNYSGAILTGQICRYLINTQNQLSCACIHAAGVHEDFDTELQAIIPTINFTKPPENQLDFNAYESLLAPIKTNIVNYIRTHNIDTIWCPIQGETILRILNHILTEIKGIHLLVQIWDPFEWYLAENKYSTDAKNDLITMFDKVILKSDFCLTASHPMATFYEERYHIPCAPIFTSHSIPNQSTRAKTNNHPFTIIISGQTYAKAGINALLRALNSMRWKYKNRPIIIKYFGSQSNIFHKYQSHVEICGYVSQSKLIEAQQNADLLYCSYFFNTSVPKTVATQSYPSKVITYLASKTPILIHSDSDTPVFQDFTTYQCGYTLNTLQELAIIKKIKEIMSATDQQKTTLINNSMQLFAARFTPEANQKTLHLALHTLSRSAIHPRILEINNIDLPGRLWNGYDLMNYLNTNTPFLANQICTYKTSTNDDVKKLYQTQKELDLEYETLQFEANRLSVHSCISIATPALLQNSIYRNADLLHFHLIHNMKLSLFSLIEMCNKKPAIISIHDPWTFTGHCVHFGSCNKYLSGCHDCPALDIMFPIKYDTSSELWKLKQFVYNHIDVDFVVSTKYMYDLFKSSPLTKGKPVHLIPFGIDIHKFTKVSQSKARAHYNIPAEHIVLFHRAQQAFKGTNFFVDALKQLKTNHKITIITCGEYGLLDEIKDKYTLIELGNIGDAELVYAYNACDFFIMPSIGESFGMMSVEAMSCGKPVICFNNTALPSVIHAPECGIAVENLNSTKLMEAINHLIEDPADRSRRGRLAQQIVKTTYNINTYNEKMLALYNHVLKRNHQNFSIANSQKVTPSLTTLQKELNHLTKKLLPTSSPQYKKLHYKISHFSHRLNYRQIKYSEPSLQILLDQYNHKLYNYYLEDIKPSFPRRIYNKTTHFSKLFIELIRNDPQTLVKVIKKRLKLPSKKGTT